MATENTTELLPLEPKARVRRKKVADAPVKAGLGSVREIRTEVTASTGEIADRGLMVVVDWDNGTQSYFTPNSLEVVKDS